VTKVFNSQPLEDRDGLARMVAENAQSLEKGLRVVDPGKGRGQWGPMDLLAVDHTGRPAIIDVAPQARDDLLVEGLSHLYWFQRYRHQVLPLLGEKTQDLIVHPRLILVAPDFSTGCQNAVAALENLSVDLFRLRLLHSDNEDGLLIELAYSTTRTEPAGKHPAQDISVPAAMIPLGEEEIASFMKMKFSLDL
jgi:RecB family endonuclease NucS